MTEKQLRKRDAKRDLGAELLQSIREMKAGKGTVVAKVDVSAAVITNAHKQRKLLKKAFKNLEEV